MTLRAAIGPCTIPLVNPLRSWGSPGMRAAASVALLTSAAMAAEPLSFTKRLSDFEGRWVVLRPTSGDGKLLFGFVYIDPQAGFTLDVGGALEVDADGRYRRVPDANPRRARILLRVDAGNNRPAAPLPGEALEQLGLDEVPEIASSYVDSSDPITHAVRWGRHHNHVAAPQQALAYLEPAYGKQPDAKGLEFELAYAYNALGRHDDALAVLRRAIERAPDDLLLGRELAYAYSKAGKLEAAVEWYLKLVPRCGEREMIVKSEMAMNLSGIYARLGDAKGAEEWRAKAKAWAPPGTPLYRHLNP